MARTKPKRKSNDKTVSAKKSTNNENANDGIMILYYIIYNI